MMYTKENHRLKTYGRSFPSHCVYGYRIKINLNRLVRLMTWIVTVKVILGSMNRVWHVLYHSNHCVYGYRIKIDLNIICISYDTESDYDGELGDQRTSTS